MLTGARMALWNGKRSPLPPGARWVEYLESTGTQWIDTGIVSDGVGLRVDVMCDKATAGTREAGIVGRLQYGDGFELYVLNGQCGLWNGPSGRSVVSSVSIAPNTIYNISAEVTSSGASITINGTANSASFTPISVSGDNIIIFNHRINYPFVGRIYSCKIYVNNVLVRDFIPVRVGQVGYLYDRVSGQLFGNAGTGAFTIGPEIIQSIIATADTTNAAQVKSWIDGVCAERGLSSVYCTLAVSSHYANNSNCVVGFSINSAGQTACIARQRGSYTLDILGPERFTSIYDAVVKAGDEFAIISPSQISITNPALTIAANTTTSNAAQVKTWLEAACAAKGITGACLTLVRPVDFTENANRVFAASVDTSGVAVNACRQRLSGAFNNIAQVNLTNAYDAVVKAGDVFAVFPSTGGAS